MTNPTIDALGATWTMLREAEIDRAMNRTPLPEWHSDLKAKVWDAFRANGYRYSTMGFGYWTTDHTDIGIPDEEG